MSENDPSILKSTSVKSKLDRSIVIQNNNQIAQYATRKDLLSAMELYKQATTEGWANTHTYCSVINANVRCGNIDQAKQVFQDLQDRKFEPDIVSYTTMIKGYVSIRDIENATKLFNEMIIISNRKKSINILPNIRTVNTILRGCVIIGSLRHAEMIVAELKTIKVTPDISSWEYITSLYCQCLLIDNALPLVGRISHTESSASGLAAIHLHIARAASLLGEYKLCSKSIKQSEAFLLSDEKYDTTQIVSTLDFDLIPELDNTAEGGKRPWKNKADDETRMQSLETFRKHRRLEIKENLAAISSYIEKRTLNSDSSMNSTIRHYAKLVSLYTRVLVLFSKQNEDIYKESPEVFINHIISSQLQQFGLLKLLEKIALKFNGHILKANLDTLSSSNLKSSKSKHSKCSKYSKQKNQSLISHQDAKESIDTKAIDIKMLFKEDTLPGVILQNIKHLYEQIWRNKDDKAINFYQLFSLSRSFEEELVTLFCDELEKTDPQKYKSLPRDSCLTSTSITSSSMPNKLEICSGAGEWAVNQAASNIDSHWITLEIRHDRVYQTFSKVLYKELSNMTILHGDGPEVLNNAFPPESLDHVFINHPEPPQQTGRQNETQAKHLLTHDFFESVSKTLQPEGKITIVTDNLWYAKLLLKEFSLATFPSSLSSLDLEEESGKSNSTTKREWNKLDETHGIHLYSGKPDRLCGHIVDSSSYFDRLWKLENLLERYFFVLIKKPSTSRHLHRQASKRFGLFSVKEVVDKNKKIKFDD